ncbi:hypothetical protein HOD29_06955 [archaeon]|jgi:hypothetical protein|nr:hypothetical protein [archaeon]
MKLEDIDRMNLIEGTKIQYGIQYGKTMHYPLAYFGKVSMEKEGEKMIEKIIVYKSKSITEERTQLLEKQIHNLDWIEEIKKIY